MPRAAARNPSVRLPPALISLSTRGAGADCHLPNGEPFQHASIPKCKFKWDARAMNATMQAPRPVPVAPKSSVAPTAPYAQWPRS